MRERERTRDIVEIFSSQVCLSLKIEQRLSSHPKSPFLNLNSFYLLSPLLWALKSPDLEIYGLEVFDNAWVPLFKHLGATVGALNELLCFQSSTLLHFKSLLSKINLVTKIKIKCIKTLIKTLRTTKYQV